MNNAAPIAQVDPGQGPPFDSYTTYRTFPDVTTVHRFPPPRSLHIKAPAEEALPELCRALGANQGPGLE